MTDDVNTALLKPLWCFKSQDNAAGSRVRNLLKNEWSSNVVVEPTAASQDTEMKLFYGEYEISLLYDNEELWRSTYNFTETDDTPKMYVVLGAPFSAPGNSVVNKRTLHLAENEKLKKQAEDLLQGIEETKRNNHKDDLREAMKRSYFLKMQKAKQQGKMRK